MNVCCRLLIGALIPFLISCAEAEPESTGQGFLFSSPQFTGGNNHIDLKVKNLDGHITLRGECPIASSYLEMSLDGGVTWSAPISYPGVGPHENLNCTNDYFLFHMMTDIFGFEGVGEALIVEVRTHNVFGVTESAFANIHYDGVGPIVAFDTLSGRFDPVTLTYHIDVYLDSPSPQDLHLMIFQEAPTGLIHSIQGNQFAPGRWAQTLRVQFNEHPMDDIQLTLEDTNEYSVDPVNYSYDIQIGAAGGSGN